ncbi:MAG: VWA domain-containing protein [Actinobacteria bacterium]|nr:VWA domain-containing protein [Actinomycetota bacterium]
MSGQQVSGEPGPDGSGAGAIAGEEASISGLLSQLRGAGLSVPVGASVLFAEALGHLDAGVDSIYWAGRSTLVCSPAEIELFDAVFRSWWLGDAANALSFVRVQQRSLDVDSAEDEHGEDDDPVDPTDAGDSSADDGADDEPTRSLRFTAAESLRARDFATLDSTELAQIAALISQLKLGGSMRRSRRQRPGRHGGRPDLRRTVRASMRTAGEPLRLHTTTTTRRPRRIVLLADISGSMELYSRVLLQFAHVAVTSGSPVEAFTIGTRLTRITRELTIHDADRALDRAASAVPDWSGGTRLGLGLRRFNDEWGVRGMARGAIIVILSDGWDRGEPAELAAEMQRLRLVAHRIVWVNPLKASAGYEPITRGMAAALPFIDDFIEGHSLDSLDALATLVAGELTR